MKPINIKEANRDKINAAIKEAEGRATARTINYDDIVDDITNIETKLNIAKKHMTGCYAWVDHNAQAFPSAYKYKPESTHYCIQRTASGWVLVSVDRMTTNSPSGRYELELTEEAQDAILESMMRFA